MAAAKGRRLIPPMRRGVLNFPRKAQFLFRKSRYKVGHGGRGSAKSWSFARALILLMDAAPLRVLCAREVQKTIKESVHRLLCDQIEAMGLSRRFAITDNSIRHILGGEFIFIGLKTDPNKIKSLEGIDIVWIEEAEKVSAESWRKLIPTIRKAGSEIWVTYNPDLETDPTALRFQGKELPPDCTVVEMNWRDNPWFTEEMRKEMQYDFKVDPDTAMHVWEGHFRRHSKAEIFAGKWRVESFDIKTFADVQGPYYGADFGFSQDPATLHRMWIQEQPERLLLVDKEAWGIGVEISDLPKFYDSIPGSRSHMIRADNSRPETISHLNSSGFHVEAATKWAGSVEDGISFLKSFEAIVIHPDCEHLVQEAKLYRYKVDKLTGDILPIVVDKWNHCWDGIRYALDPLISLEERDTVVVGDDVHISHDLDDIDDTPYMTQW